ncbi:MAG: hypothetical protein WEH44_04240 [Pirellulaceae bacterium]
MIRFSWGLAGCLVAAALVASVDAQEGQQGRRGGFGFGGGFNNVLSVAGNEAVQKEIGADEATVGKIRAVNQEYRDALETEAPFNPQDLQNLSEEERRTKFRELSEKRTAVTAKFEPKLKEALTADQFKRVQEINIRAMGVFALTNRDVAKDLAVSDDQAKKIAEIQTEYGQKRRDLGGDATPEARRTLGEDELKAAIAVLNKEQQDKLTALRGKEFDTSVLRQGRGGNRPGGDGNRPGGKRGAKRPDTE